ncbi:MAG: hypothetical protein ACYTEQ_14870 [Planctomycetota bacterium]
MSQTAAQTTLKVRTPFPPPPATPEKAAWVESERQKWDALNAHMTPQFEGQRAYNEHGFAKYRCTVLGSLHAASAPDPDTPEFETLLKGNSEDLMDWMRKAAGKDLKDLNPKLWDEMCEESDELATIMRQAGVKVIRNESETALPDGLINMHAGWGSSRYLSVYCGCSYGRIMRNIYFNVYDQSLTGMCEMHHRQGTIKLFEHNPDLIYYTLPYPEPDISVPGIGSLMMDVAGHRLFPNKHILFAVGVADESLIPKVLAAEPKKALEYTSAGIPHAAEFMMRMLKREGFTHELIFFNSKLTYHFDCFMAQMAEGVVGLPDLPDYGIWGGKLPECLKGWEIVRMPVEDVHNGSANQINLGDGRSIVVRTAKETMKRMKAAGVEPIPVKFDKIWATWHSGPDCSDGDVWRENDPVKEIPNAPPPLA